MEATDGCAMRQKVHIKLKDKVYKTVIKPIISYGAGSWAVRKKEIQEQIARSGNEDATMDKG